MAGRSLNKVQLIGNLTRDPELRYTPAGTAVCSFSIATNRVWTTQSGDKKEEADFHRIVSWNKLAEICSQFLAKGRKVYVEGRLSTRSWQAQDGTQRSTTEVVASDMIILDSRRDTEGQDTELPRAPDEVETPPDEAPADVVGSDSQQPSSSAKKSKPKSDKKETKEEETPGVPEDEIPF